MKCDKCGNEDLHVVSEYVELSKKKQYAITSILALLASILLAVGVVILLVSMISCAMDKSVSSYPSFIVSLSLICGSFVFFLILNFIRIFQPYEHTTRLRVVCLKCGKSWRIPVKDVEEQTKTEENKTESN